MKENKNYNGKLFKFIRYFFIGLAVFLLPVLVHAQVVITEIMYDIEGADTGREWIEVQNTGTEPVDFSTWKIFEANVNHKITAVSDVNIPSLGFAIIVDNVDKFKADNPGFSGLIFDSAFSLSNDGEILILRDSALADSDSVTYSPAVGGQGDTTTLQKALAGGWISALPTVGSQTTATESFQPAPAPDGTTTGNNASSTPASAPDDTEVADEIPAATNTYSAHASQSLATVSRDIEDLQVTSGRPRLGFVGSPLSFEAKIKVAKNIQSGSLEAVWSLGDGNQKTGQTIEHVYQFSGEYIVILNAGIGAATAVSKTRVRIVEPRISFNFNLDGYVEVSNLSDLELNIGGWIIESETVRFIVPTDTLISKKSSIKIPSTSTRISTYVDFVRIANPSGKIIASLGAIAREQITPEIILPPGMNESLLKEKLRELTYRY